VEHAAFATSSFEGEAVGRVVLGDRQLVDDIDPALTAKAAKAGATVAGLAGQGLNSQLVARPLRVACQVGDVGEGGPGR
jgi:hypothetical protein